MTVKLILRNQFLATCIPIRVQEYSEFSAVNYHKWPICDAACSLGNELKVPVYKFTKEALIRKFGLNWFLQLEKLVSEL